MEKEWVALLSVRYEQLCWRAYQAKPMQYLSDVWIAAQLERRKAQLAWLTHS